MERAGTGNDNAAMVPARTLTKKRRIFAGLHSLHLLTTARQGRASS